MLTLVETERRSRLPWALADAAPLEVRAFGDPVKIPYLIAFEGYYALIAELVRQASIPETASIIELGSGAGYNLCRIWLSGGPRGIPYYACELTEAGRRCTEKFASLEADLSLIPVPFDYESPDYSAIPHGARHVVIFTSQGIEQIPNIKRKVFDKILDIADRITCLHFEPIGWQVSQGLDAGDAGAVSAAYAEESDYNRNLWGVLRMLEDEGLIQIDMVERDLFGLVPINSITVVRWQKSR